VNNSTTTRRNPTSNESMDPYSYLCRKVNYDYSMSYAQLDAWAHQPNFQPLISAAMARQMSLDRIMMGFNGTSYSDPSDRAANPLFRIAVSAGCKKSATKRHTVASPASRSPRAIRTMPLSPPVRTATSRQRFMTPKTA
jgi:hypothetical protein